MSTEDQAWRQLRERGAAQISPGFADRALRAAQGSREPLILSHLGMCAATAALCVILVALFDGRTSADESAKNLAGWTEIVAQANDVDQGL